MTIITGQVKPLTPLMQNGSDRNYWYRSTQSRIGGIHQQTLNPQGTNSESTKLKEETSGLHTNYIAFIQAFKHKNPKTTQAQLKRS